MTQRAITLSDPSRWTFVGGEWRQSDDDVILPPAESRSYGPQNFQAFYGELTAYDLEADYEIRINGMPSFCEPRLIVRAQDPAGYYAVGLPSVGQSWRSKGIWAAIWRVEAGGMHRLLDFKQVPGVPAEHGRWYRCRLTCTGSTIGLSIDGRPVVSACDETYGAGRIGLGAWGPAEFRNVRVQGDDEAAPTWQDEARPAVPWFSPDPLDDDAVEQYCHAVRRLPSRRLLMWLGRGQFRLSAEGKVHAVVRLVSDDAVRTWGDPKVVSAANTLRGADSLEGALAYYTLPDSCGGRVRALYQSSQDARDTFVLDSPDEGVTFGEPKRVTIEGDWPARPDRWLGYSMLVTGGGEILRFYYTEPLPHTRQIAEMPAGGGMTWAGVASQAYVMRSTDGGDTWSAPVNLDGVWWPGVDKPIEPNFDMTEAAACVAPDGSVCCMVRPISSPVMWQTWSRDGGQTWEPSAYGPFPGYQLAATQTTGGAMVFCLRFPCITVYVSHDGGVTWKGTMIDYAAQGPDPGGMLEVEADIILITYNMVSAPRRVRAQRLRVTPGGVEPD